MYLNIFLSSAQQKIKYSTKIMFLCYIKLNIIVAAGECCERQIEKQDFNSMMTEGKLHAINNNNNNNKRCFTVSTISSTHLLLFGWLAIIV